MATAIIVYLIVGVLIVYGTYGTLSDVVRDECLAIKIGYYTAMSIIAPAIFIYGIGKGIYQGIKKNKLES